ncbi:PepSY domain-containing protein [Asanoa sp. NPDC049573]|uniref:PepSY domain-containing protein n=1 Tax=Asanoa sp. NPDC049573 TaxID=3155396 RepID=UPI003412D7E2
MKRTPVIVTLAGLAALAVTGTALAATDDPSPAGSAVASTAEPTPTFDDNPGPDDSPSPDAVPTDDAAPTPSDSATDTQPPLRGNVSAAEAERIALARVGGGSVTKIESEYEHGFSTWKVEVVRSGVEHDVYVDRATGRVIKSDSEATDDRVGGGRDDGPTHDADDDKGGDRATGGDDDGPNDDAGDDKGGERGGRH